MQGDNIKDYSLDVEVKELHVSKSVSVDEPVDVGYEEVTADSLNFDDDDTGLTDNSGSTSDVDVSGDIESMDDLFAGATEFEEVEDSDELVDLFNSAEEFSEDDDTYGLVGIDEVSQTDTYSKDFMDREISEFIIALDDTIGYRTNRTEDNNVHYYGKLAAAKRNMSRSARIPKNEELYVTIIKRVLDAVRDYNNDEVDLPPVIRDFWDGTGVLQYDDAVVWKAIDEEIKNTLTRSVRLHFEKRRKNGTSGSDKSSEERFLIKELNIYNNLKTSVYNRYSIMYVEYKGYDASARRARVRNTTGNIKNRIEFGFLYECRDSLSNGADAALCNKLVFNNGDQLYYRFKCGKCNEIVNGAKSIKTDHGEFDEDSPHGFYEVLTTGLQSLHYPMICEKCGAINFLSKTSREALSSGIKMEPSADSYDKSSYKFERDNDRRRSTAMQSSDRRLITYNKWRDLLRAKIERTEMGEEELSAIDFYDTSIDEQLDSFFYIDTEDAPEVNGITASLSLDDYKNAIKTFRHNNDIYNTMRMLSGKVVNLDESVEMSLAVLAYRDKFTLIHDIFDYIASYIKGTYAFKELSKLYTAKCDAYDIYLTYNSAIKLNVIGDGVSDATIADFTKEYSTEWDMLVLDKERKLALESYEEAKAKYEAFRDIIYSNYRVYSFKRKDKIVGALNSVAEVFGCDEKFVEFFIEVFRGTVENLTTTESKSAMGMMSKGNKLSVSPVKGVSNINDQEHKLSNKFETVLEYSKRIKNVSNYKEFKHVSDKILKEFYDDYRKYIQFSNWCNTFRLNEYDNISDILADKSSIAMGWYNKNLRPLFGELSNYSGELITLLPNFSSKLYYKILLGINSVDNNLIMADADAAFNSLLRYENFQILDMLFCKLSIANVGESRFFGMDRKVMARSLRMMNGIVVKHYNSAKKSLDLSVSKEARFRISMSRICNHKFLHNRNYAENIDVLYSYYLDSNNSDNTAETVDIEQVERQLEYVKEELCNDTKYLDVELPILEQ